MRRCVAVIGAAALTVLGAPVEVGADPGHARPRVTVMRWQDPPVTVTSGECEEEGVCDQEVLIVKAHDPDSSITEVQVWFDENGERAPFVMAHTFCLQGKKPGTPARLELGVSFSEPGDYTVAAVAYSHERCSGHEEGDAHAERHSRIKRLETTVLEAEE